MAAAVAVLMGMAALLLILSRRKQQASGLPPGKLIYSDTGTWRKVEKPYFDARWGLTGKPDYVVEAQGMQIPVEVKSASADQPYESHILQLAAYCRLIEVSSGKRPPLGLIKYRNRVFEVEYTQELERKLQSLVFEIQQIDAAEDLPRSHHSASRCAGCGYATGCAQRLDSPRKDSPK